MSVDGLRFHLKQVTNDVILFQKASRLVFEKSEAGRYSVQEANSEAAKLGIWQQQIQEKIGFFQRALSSNRTLDDNEKPLFSKSTELADRNQTSCSRTITSLNKIAQVSSGNPADTTSHVYVYYDGPGDLFVRGEDASVLLPQRKSASLDQHIVYGDSKKLSWEDGVPLVQEANHLWRMTLMVPAGKVARYKFLISNSEEHWSKGENYTLHGQKRLIHIPAFGEKVCSLIVPMDVGPGNKLVLSGEGEVLIQNQPVSLSWEEGIDLQCIGPNLWVLPLSASDTFKFKLFLIKDGEMIWEKAENRSFAQGKDLILGPDFGPGHGKLYTMEEAVLGKQLLDEQSMVQQRLKDEAAQKQAEIETRPRPCLIDDNSKCFKDEEVIQVNPPVRIEEMKIGGTTLQVGFTDTGKSLLHQQAKDGCTAGVSAMLIIDHGALPREEDLLNRVRATYEETARDIANAGLKPVCTSVLQFKSSLKLLREQLLKHGPAYVSYYNNNTGHAIIVDEISEDLKRVTIRDPWHGWQFIVKGDAFIKYWNEATKAWNKDQIVQVEKR
jgi:hypothetical protein